jgi:hypothetical protein
MTPGHDWYLKEWLATLGKKQPYDRDSLNELAAYLHLEPHELLMHPADAMALRQLKATAKQIVEIPFGGVAGDEPSEIKVSAA